MKLTRSALKEMIREILDEISAAGAASGGVKKSGGKSYGGMRTKSGTSNTGGAGGKSVMRKRSHKRRRKIRKPIHGLR